MDSEPEYAESWLVHAVRVRHPLLFSAAALVLVGVALKIGVPHQCDEDATTRHADDLLLGAAALQCGGLAYALALWMAGKQGAGRWLA